MQCVAPASTSISAETSPVNAPCLCSAATSWAATCTVVPTRASATARKAVNGGATTTSQCVTPSTRSAIDRAVATASAIVLYIFQFPAMTGFLIGVVSIQESVVSSSEQESIGAEPTDY